jgi:hypothetical protein
MMACMQVHAMLPGLICRATGRVTLILYGSHRRHAGWWLVTEACQACHQHPLILTGLTRMTCRHILPIMPTGAVHSGSWLAPRQRLMQSADIPVIPDCWLQQSLMPVGTAGRGGPQAQCRGWYLCRISAEELGWSR